MKHTLTPADIGELDRLEAIIDKEQSGFLRVGGALMAIREQRLYLRDFDSFEAYCQNRWKFSARRALQLIDAAVVVQELPSKSGTIVPIETESQARELAKVKPDEREAVLEKVVESGKPVTAKAIKEAAKAEKPTAPADRLDAIGRVIPPAIVAEWDRATAVGKELRAHASAIKVAIQHGLDEKDKIFAEITNPTISEAAAIHYTLSQILPHAVCPTCHGLIKDKCQMCLRRGWISKYRYDSPAVPKELKAILERAKK